VKEIRDALEKIPDPKTNILTAVRVRGPPKAGDPPINRVLSWLLRRWMIKPDVLAQHPEWIEDRRVVSNGVAWGDAEDPAES
ncbi:hypothetical protein BDV93DRAFT_408177, partial [Ceratobasidium sp. AG-I]